MIIATITSGLGNQLFQYALARQLSIKNNASLYFDKRFYGSDYARESQRGFKLDNFNIGYRELTMPIQYLMKFTKLFSEQTLHPFFSLQKEKYYHFNPAVLDSADQFIILKGYWHSEKYFGGIEHIIREELKFTKVTGHQFAIYKSEVEKSPISVSVHVRRGDYVHHPEFSKTFGFIGLEYYDSAIAEIEERYPNARYFVFTDDPAWVKVNLKLKPNTVYVENNGPDADIDDLHLMSLCMHNIIANSSFSWWGAWLNNNPQKIVIAPKKWFKNQPEWDTKDLLPDSWLAI